MARRELGKTAIEGGRYQFYKFMRKRSLRVVRHQTRIFTRLIRDHVDTENIGCFSVYPERTLLDYALEEFKFKDKLKPVQRWLRKRVDLPWDETYSLMRQKFDSRTTPGRHILFDHLLGEVWTSPDRTAEPAKHYTYYVDTQGILQTSEEPWYRKEQRLSRRQYRIDRLPPALHKAERNKIVKWLGVRRIGWVGSRYFWFVPTRRIPKDIEFTWHIGQDWGWIYTEMTKLGPRRVGFASTFRQDQCFSKTDLEFFWSLSNYNRQLLLKGRPRTSVEISKMSYLDKRDYALGYRMY